MLPIAETRMVIRIVRLVPPPVDAESKEVKSTKRKRGIRRGEAVNSNFYVIVTKHWRLWTKKVFFCVFFMCCECNVLGFFGLQTARQVWSGKWLRWRTVSEKRFSVINHPPVHRVPFTVLVDVYGLVDPNWQVSI